jgi:hypothetical protein
VSGALSPEQLAACFATGLLLAAASLGFGPMDLFNMPESEREVPKVALR